MRTRETHWSLEPQVSCLWLLVYNALGLALLACAGWIFVNLTKARITWEEEPQTPSDWLVGICVGGAIMGRWSWVF
ncbi:hypothetical protein I79_007939 [Cricetulus griseus]|uniref:Uncharacterized protein n=1 Tax=Cricetulus griseus TaxID=10029 RepID=G3HBN5_CRIGR|nr:hypothetical protein I79_007939 [Cricetulus griseus]